MLACQRTARLHQHLTLQVHACTPFCQPTATSVCAGMRTRRYYRGRHFLQERSRTAKRINLAALQHRNSSSSSAKPCASASMLLLPPTTPLLPPTKPGSAAGGQGSAAQLQEQHAGSTRRLAIPDPAFIPLEAPQELLQQSQQQQQQQEGDAGSWRQQHGYAGAGPGRQKGMAVTELVEQVGAPKTPARTGPGINHASLLISLDRVLAAC